MRVIPEAATFTPFQDQAGGMFRRMRVAPRRTLLEFATAEIILPDGPYQGHRFRPDYQPWAKLWMDAIDSGQWNRFALFGCVQSGKTLAGWIIPTLYALFELGTTVVCGIPDLDMASDKWAEDLFPVIEGTQYREHLPRRGAGSRGGTPRAIRFRNGTTLKFMGAGGGEGQRAGFTTRVVVITEADKMDVGTVGSSETDKVSQMLARCESFPDEQQWIFIECTVTTETGRIFREWKAGTQSAIALPCPHCTTWIQPGRGDVIGWRDAETIHAARTKTAWTCPACAKPLDENQRAAANRGGRIVHAGQKVEPSGQVAGPVPAADTFSLRYGAWHNLFTNAGRVGAAEWRSDRDPDNEGYGEKYVAQLIHATPWTPPDIETGPMLTRDGLVKTVDRFRQGMVPAGASWITVGIDIGKRYLHFTVLAVFSDYTAHVIDYGVRVITSDEDGIIRATLAALREWGDLAAVGYPQGETMRPPAATFIDARYAESAEAVFAFCREVDKPASRYLPAFGHSATQNMNRTYRSPRKKSKEIRILGLEYHVAKHRRARCRVVHVNGDFWKSRIHRAFLVPAGSAGRLTLWEPTSSGEHRSFAHHITREREVQKVKRGIGAVTVWERVNRGPNHWLDATYNAYTAAHFAGARMVQEEDATPKAQAGTDAASWLAKVNE